MDLDGCSADVFFIGQPDTAVDANLKNTHTHNNTPSLYPEAQVGHGQLCAGMVPRSFVLLASPQGRVSLAAQLYGRGGA